MVKIDKVKKIFLCLSLAHYPSLTEGLLNFIWAGGLLYRQSSTPCLIRREWNQLLSLYLPTTYLLTFNCSKMDSKVKYKLPYHIQKSNAVVIWEWMETGYKQYYLNNLHSILTFLWRAWNSLYLFSTKCFLPFISTSILKTCENKRLLLCISWYVCFVIDFFALITVANLFYLSKPHDTQEIPGCNID